MLRRQLPTIITIILEALDHDEWAMRKQGADSFNRLLTLTASHWTILLLQPISNELHRSLSGHARWEGKASVIRALFALMKWYFENTTAQEALCFYTNCLSQVRLEWEQVGIWPTEDTESQRYFHDLIQVWPKITTLFSTHIEKKDIDDSEHTDSTLLEIWDSVAKQVEDVLTASKAPNVPFV